MSIWGRCLGRRRRGCGGRFLGSSNKDMNASISVNQPKVRQSNFELLRIIAMFMVLILHADFQALGAPDKSEIINHPIAATFQVLFEMASIIAVNVFVLISGWFGIRPSVKGISKFIFQVLFFSLGIYVVALIKGDVQFSYNGLADCFAMKGGGYWFITSYIFLYILSPVLNAFIETSNKTLYKKVLIAFFIFQTIYGFCSSGASFFSRGYSAVSFMGLYLLARYFKRYVDTSKYTKSYIIIYIFCTCLLALIYFCTILFEIQAISKRVDWYSNPFVVLSALSLLLFCSKIKLQSRLINWISSSSFAVYLLHTNSNIYTPYYIHGIQNLNMDYSMSFLFTLATYIFLWFVVAILLDQVRKILWEKCINKL